MAFVPKKRYGKFRGLNLRDNPLLMGHEYASKMRNVAPTIDADGIEKRLGFAGYGQSAGGFGAFLFHHRSPTGSVTNRRLVVGETLYESLESTLSVSYAGAAVVVTLSMFYDTATSQYRFKIVKDGVTSIDQALGVGVDEAVPYSLNSLVTALNLVAGITASVSGDGTKPAAFIRIVRNYDLKAAAYSGKAGYLVALDNCSNSDTGSGAPFYEVGQVKNTEDFENVSAIQINNVMYFSHLRLRSQTLGGGVFKFDGASLYHAGLKQPSQVTIATNGAGAITGNNYQYLVRMKHIDASGNEITSNHQISGLVNAVAQQLRMTLTLAIPPVFRWNTNAALVNGATGVLGANATITVDDGLGGAHTLVVKNKAFFYNVFSTRFEYYNVTARTATTITLDNTGPIQLADNQVISAGLFAEIYRSKTSGSAPTTWYFVDTLVVSGFDIINAVSMTYDDNKTDAQLAGEFIEPLVDLSPPEAGAYIASWDGLLVTASFSDGLTFLKYGDVEFLEAMPADDNELDVENGSGSVITGIAQDGVDFVVMKKHGITIITGDPTTGAVALQELPGAIGCEAHATICRLDIGLAWLSERGPMKLVSRRAVPLGGDPKLGGLIEPVFTKEQLLATSATRLQLRRAVAVNDERRTKYILFCPAETTTGGNVHANASSRVFAFDYAKDSWWEWNALNMAGGAMIDGEDMFHVERRYSLALAAGQTYFYQRHSLADAWSYQDNNAAIDWLHGSNWEHMGDANLRKTFVECCFFMPVRLTPSNTWALTVATEFDRIETQRSSISATNPNSDPKVYAKYGRGRYESMRMTISNSAAQSNVDLAGWQVHAETAYVAGARR